MAAQPEFDAGRVVRSAAGSDSLFPGAGPALLLALAGCALPDSHLPGGFSSTYYKALQQSHAAAYSAATTSPTPLPADGSAPPAGSGSGWGGLPLMGGDPRAATPGQATRESRPHWFGWRPALRPKLAAAPLDDLSSSKTVPTEPTPSVPLPVEEEDPAGDVVPTPSL